jgi:Ca2+-binding EF-hand superfamily protein
MYSIQVDILTKRIIRFFIRDSYLSTDGSGKISQKELGNIFKALNMKINDSQLKKLVTEMDTDGSGMHEKN